jgi:chromosome segregation ATPase
LQARAAQNGKDAQRQLETATTQLQVMTDRLNQVQLDAHDLSMQLQDAERSQQLLEAQLHASPQAALQAELQAARHRLLESESAARQSREAACGLEGALQQAAQQRAALESTISSLIVCNDDLHAHVQQARTQRCACCQILTHANVS